MLDVMPEMIDNSFGTGSAEKTCVIVRYADETDLPQVLGMYMAGLAEIRDMIVEPNAQKCARKVLLSWAQAPCVLLEKMGKIIGFAGLCTNKPDYSEQNVISEYMFYIKPEHRSYKAAKMLSDASKDVADKFGLPLFFTHKLGGGTIETKEKFLTRWGYRPVAVNCIYGGQHGR